MKKRRMSLRKRPMKKEIKIKNQKRSWELKTALS